MLNFHQYLHESQQASEMQAQLMQLRSQHQAIQDQLVNSWGTMDNSTRRDLLNKSQSLSAAMNQLQGQINQISRTDSSGNK